MPQRENQAKGNSYAIIHHEQEVNVYERKNNRKCDYVTKVNVKFWQLWSVFSVREKLFSEFILCVSYPQKPKCITINKIHKNIPINC